MQQRERVRPCIRLMISRHKSREKNVYRAFCTATAILSLSFSLSLRLSLSLSFVFFFVCLHLLRIKHINCKRITAHCTQEGYRCRTGAECRLVSFRRRTIAFVGIAAVFVGVVRLSAHAL